MLVIRVGVVIAPDHAVGADDLGEVALAVVGIAGLGAGGIGHRGQAALPVVAEFQRPPLGVGDFGQPMPGVVANLGGVAGGVADREQTAVAGELESRAVAPGLGVAVVVGGERAVAVLGGGIGLDVGAGHDVIEAEINPPAVALPDRKTF